MRRELDPGTRRLNASSNRQMTGRREASEAVSGRRVLPFLLATLLLTGCGSTPVRPLPATPSAATVIPSTATPAARPSTTLALAGQPAASSPASSREPLATAFTTPVPPSAVATWAALTWQPVAAADPLRLVRSALRWSGGFLAVGRGGSGTPVWTSRDGAQWDPLPFDTATTFWPGLLVVGVAEVRDGLVALTLLAGNTDCAAAPSCPVYSPTLPLTAWTSPDGRSWTPHGGPNLGSPADWPGPPLLASGPAGLVVAAPTVPTRVATSTDGIHWRTLPARALPADVRIGGLAADARGFTAVGTQQVSADQARGVAFQSTDGATWIGPSALLDPTASVMLASTGASWGASALVSARDGYIAEGGYLFSMPGAALWWHSADGRAWQVLPGYPPLGPTTCIGEGCGGQPDGSLLGDGNRMVALRGGADAGAWTSRDGLAWQRLRVSGDGPDAPATAAGAGSPPVLLPGGILASDGSATWFGSAGTR